MTLTDPFVAHRPAGDPPSWRVVAGGDRTGGQVVFGEALLKPGESGPPRHVHTHEDEAILIVSGVLTVHLGDDTHEAGPGSLAWMAREVPHHFVNLGVEPVRAFGVITPAGIEKFFEWRDSFLEGLDGPPTPEDVQRIMDTNARYGIRPA
jgi:mannose-6-phosphate isomerase-like protein (cupin superfamily)